MMMMVIMIMIMMVEKNADAWSKAKIKVKESLVSECWSMFAQELFENHVIEVPSVGNVILEEVDKIDL